MSSFLDVNLLDLWWFYDGNRPLLGYVVPLGKNFCAEPAARAISGRKCENHSKRSLQEHNRKFLEVKSRRLVHKRGRQSLERGGTYDPLASSFSLASLCFARRKIFGSQQSGRKWLARLILRYWGTDPRAKAGREAETGKEQRHRRFLYARRDGKKGGGIVAPIIAYRNKKFITLAMSK